MSFRKFWENRSRASYTEFFDDFHKVSDYVTGDFTATIVGTGTATNVGAGAGGSGGVLALANSAADNDGIFLQNKNETFKFVLGLALEFECRFKVLEAIQCDFAIGLQITDTTPLAVSDGIFFQKDDEDAHLDFHAFKNGVSTDLTDFAELAANTWVKLGFYYDGATVNPTWQVFVNNKRVGAIKVDANTVDDEELSVSFGMQNGQAVINTMSVDYIRVVQERPEP